MMRLGISSNPFNLRASPLRDGGDKGGRTPDLLLARQALSQLSYAPTNKLVGLDGLEPSTSRLSGVRSNQLSYRPACCPIFIPSKLNKE